ncbi:unnamed protein product [Arabidopsis thaliana]|uniref:Uncharacterized protein n=1 Tax=Arabidopsis thaliana TaxID=3702 RepID=A0A654EG23_ARATH|nr:unnamed protein product [Arabidopsis thaliana]
MSATAISLLSPFKLSLAAQAAMEHTPVLWPHGIDEKAVLFEAGQAALPFLQQAGLTYEFKSREFRY